MSQSTRVGSHLENHPNDVEAQLREEFLAEHTILGSVVGSRLQGVATPESDTDEMAVAVEPPSSVFGGQLLDSVVYRPRADGEASQPGDVERTTYSLRKFLALARKGNPHILQVLWAPEEFLFTITPLGVQLRELRSVFVSAYAISSHLGYAAGELAQVKKGLAPDRKRRPELSAKCGYDAKAAGHILRLCYQGRVLATEGFLPVPLPEPVRSKVLELRSGAVPFSKAVELLETEIAELSATRDRVRGSLPDTADLDAVVSFSITAHQEWWKAKGLI